MLSKEELLARTNKGRKNNGIALDDNMVNTVRDKNVIYLFDAYKRNEGLDIVSKSAFGCDFYNLDNGCYGDDLEYTIFEMIEHGTIVLLDYDAGDKIHLYDINGNRNDKSMLNNQLGIFLKKDCSNIEDCLNIMDKLTSQPTLYNNMRLKIYNAYKDHCNPQMVVNKFMNDIFK
jgi:hypothetical protein